MTAIETWTFPDGMGVPHPSGAYAHATAHGDVLYVTGQLPVDPETNALVADDIVAQTNQVLKNLARVVELCEFGFDRVIQARSFLAAERDFAGYDKTFRSWFPTRFPSRTTVVVMGFAIPDALVEIDLVVAR